MTADCPGNRRCFLKAGGLALAMQALPALATPHARTPARLVGRGQRPLTTAELVPDEAYVFHYPYVSTPCFLLDLGEPLEPAELRTEDGQVYTWPGGVGPRRSIVAFSAICSHRMSHPAPSVSFINYREERVRYLDKAEQERTEAGVIYCCSERSVFDPRHGARVLGGPAPQPLAAVTLAYHEDGDGLTATGTAGGALFERFFERFGMRLMLSHGPRYQEPVGEWSRVRPAADFSSNQMRCG